MRNAKMIVALGLAVLALGACKKQQPAPDQNISIDEGVPDNQMVGNADIETLPAGTKAARPRQTSCRTAMTIPT